jgi:hypothetical protein
MSGNSVPDFVATTHHSLLITDSEFPRIFSQAGELSQPRHVLQLPLPAC